MTQALADKQNTICEPREKKARQNWLLNALEFIVVLMLALLCLEPLLTLAGAADDQIQDLDPVAGWCPVGNRSFLWRREQYCRSRFNSMGMRGPERGFAKPPNTLRIAVLGCSLTEALQVPYDRTYCGVLEQQLDIAPPQDKKVEVLNFGVSGYSLGQEYLRMTSYVFKFNPDLVIIAIRPHALQAKNMLGPPPEFSVAADGRLILDRSKQTAWLRSPMGQIAAAASWLRYHSRLWGFVSICAEQIAYFNMDVSKQLQEVDALTNKLIKLHIAPHTALPEDELVYENKLMPALLKASDDACKGKDCRFMLVGLPDLRKTAVPGELALMKDCASDLSLNYLDLNPAFDELDKHPHKPWLFVTHFTEDGHRIIGERIAAFIEQRKLFNHGEPHAD